MHCLLNIFLRFGAILQMAPKRTVQTIRGQPGKTRRRVPAAAAGSAVAASDATGPDADIGSTASELELNIKFTDWPNATKTKEKRTWGGWTLALIGAAIGTNEPSIAPTTLAKPPKKPVSID